MIYVTHDQKEAMALADRIAVMNEGKIVQIDTPENLYYRPRNRFVAVFIGEMNFLKGTVEGIEDGKLKIKTDEGKFLVKTEMEGFSGEEIEIGFRPESVELKEGVNQINGRIKEKEYQGEITKLNIISERGNIFTITLLSSFSYNLNVGEKIKFTIAPERILIFKK